MNLSKLLFCNLIFLQCFFISLYAAGKEPFAFLMMTPSPRAAAMGEAFAGLANGPEAIAYNPGGIAFEKKIHLFTQSLIPPFVEDIKYNDIIYVQPKQGGGAYAVQIGYLHSGGFTQTVADPAAADGYSEVSSFSTYDFQAAGAIGDKIGDALGIGATFRFARESLKDIRADAYVFDVGILYSEPGNPVQFGTSLQNIGPKVKFQDDSFNLPMLYRVGFAAEKTKNFDVKIIPNKSLLLVDYFKPVSGEQSVRGGIEVPLGVHLALRAGYNHIFKDQELGLGSKIVPQGFTMGFGVKGKSWQVDYANLSQGELGLSHRISLDLKWADR